MQCVFKMLFKEDSFKESGTLYQLKVLLNCKQVKLHKSKISDFDAADNFFNITLSSYIVAAAMNLLNMDTLDDEPGKNNIIAEDEWLKDPDTCRDALYALSSIVKKYIDLSMDTSTVNTESEEDIVKEYACSVLSCGLLYVEFCDGIKEGDRK